MRMQRNDGPAPARIVYMRSVAARVARSVVCVCLCVGHAGERCGSGWTDQDAACREALRNPRLLNT